MTLSVVVVVRNDNYGLYLRDRLNCFFKSIQNCPYNLELILVEWNPPSENKTFYEEFKTILPTNCNIKIVTVSNNTHIKLPNSNHFPVFEFIAKNCGARHCSGEYILFTNPDNIFNQNIWKETFESLSPEFFLRAPRHDLFHNEIIDYETSTIDEILSKSVIKYQAGYNGEGLFDYASGDFLCVKREIFYTIKGYDEKYTYSYFDGMILKKLSNFKIIQKVLNNCTHHIDHSRPNLSLAQSLNLMTDYWDTEHTYNDDWGLLNENIKIQIV